MIQRALITGLILKERLREAMTHNMIMHTSSNPLTISHAINAFSHFFILITSTYQTIYTNQTFINILISNSYLFLNQFLHRLILFPVLILVDKMKLLILHPLDLCSGNLFHSNYNHRFNMLFYTIAEFHFHNFAG